MNMLRLTRRFRAWALLLAVVAGVISWGMHAQPENWSAPVFEPLLDMLPLAVWQWMWLAVSALMLVAVVSARSVPWLIGSVLAIAVSSTWLIGLTWAWVALDARLSPSGWALWLYLAMTQGFVVTAQGKYEGQIES